MLKIFVLSIVFTLLCACSSVEKAGVVYHDSFDFLGVKSYSLYERNSLFGESQNLLGTRRNSIEIAIEKTMAKKKFSYETLEKADVIITYHVFNAKGKEYANYNETVRFCAHCLRATAWQTDQQYSSISKGSLVLDIIDPKQHRSVWRSIYPLEIEVKENSAETNQRIIQAVSAMLDKYPKNKAKITQ
jgi:hypothetical protein